jgi:hypothetical protein
MITLFASLESEPWEALAVRFQQDYEKPEWWIAAVKLVGPKPKLWAWMKLLSGLSLLVFCCLMVRIVVHDPNARWALILPVIWGVINLGLGDIQNQTCSAISSIRAKLNEEECRARFCTVIERLSDEGIL